MSMTLRYHVPEIACRQLTTRPSYCGHTWESLIRSAEITADAWGRGYIVVTRSNGERAGGRVLVTRDPSLPQYGLSVVLLAEVQS